MGKPRVLLEPTVVSWAWVREWKDRGGVFPPTLDGGSEWDSLGVGQTVILRVVADHQRKPDVVEMSQERFMPEFGTFFSRRQIPGITRPRIAKPHRKKSHQADVVKLRPFNSHPS